MTIHKAKASDYSSVKTDSIVDYIQDYTTDIFNAVYPQSIENKIGAKLANCDRTQLKTIAAELETVKKRLDYILYGMY